PARPVCHDSGPAKTTITTITRTSRYDGVGSPKALSAGQDRGQDRGRAGGHGGTAAVSRPVAGLSDEPRPCGGRPDQDGHGGRSIPLARLGPFAGGGRR